jgi:hypothetical protein
MNERIRKLLNEATSGLEPDLSEQRTVTLNEMEKFAELIVKGCADYVQFYYKDHMCEVIAHNMKQHFGVEP